MSVFDFYKNRIKACPLYGFKSGHELLGIIQKCAQYDLYDGILTFGEYNIIINLCQKAHIKMMEDNYNAGWQDDQ